MENESVNQVAANAEDIKAGSKGNGHGGARAGAGRKKVAGRDCALGVKISFKARENLGRYCEEAEVSLSEALNDILESLY